MLEGAHVKGVTVGKDGTITVGKEKGGILYKLDKDILDLNNDKTRSDEENFLAVPVTEQKDDSHGGSYSNDRNPSKDKDLSDLLLFVNVTEKGKYGGKDTTKTYVIVLSDSDGSGKKGDHDPADVRADLSRIIKDVNPKDILPPVEEQSHGKGKDETETAIFSIDRAQAKSGPWSGGQTKQVEFRFFSEGTFQKNKP